MMERIDVPKIIDTDEYYTKTPEPTKGAYMMGGGFHHERKFIQEIICDFCGKEIQSLEDYYELPVDGKLCCEKCLTDWSE